MNQEQITYVVSQLQAGASREEVAQILRENGYKEELIASLLSEADRQMASNDTITSTESAGVTERSAVTAENVTLPPAFHLFKEALRFTFTRIDLLGWYILTLLSCIIIFAIVTVMVGFLSFAMSGVLGLIPFILLYLCCVLFIFVFPVGALVYSVSHKKTVSYKEGLQYMLHHFWSWSWLVALLWFVLFGVIVVVLLPVGGLVAVTMAVIGSMLDPLVALTLIPLAIFGVGLLVNIVCGLVYVGVAFNKLVFIHEELRGVNALSRSRQLVRGHWWGVLGRLLLPLGLVFVTLFLVQVILGLVTDGSGAGEILSVVIQVIGSLLSIVIFARVTTLLYYSLASNAPAFTPEAPDSKLFYTIFAWLGGLALLAGIILMVLSLQVLMPTFSGGATTAAPALDIPTNPLD